MRKVCNSLRMNVLEAGRTPGLAAFLNLYGLRVEEAPIPTAGRLDYEAGRYIVRVQRTRHRGELAGTRRRRAQPPTPLLVSKATNRQRFTIAHEIGHAILFESMRERPEMLTRLRDPALWAEVEALCDVAASELLVPVEALVQLLSQHGSSMRALARLADRFRVAREVLYRQVLAAGALSLSLWRVSESTGTGAPVATLIRVLADAPFRHAYVEYAGPALTPASALIPEIVVAAARYGRAQAAALTVTSGGDSWHGAGIAACHEPSGTHAEQPPLLGTREMVGSGSQPPATDALVTLLLLPSDAVTKGWPLWAALGIGGSQR